MGDLGVAIDGRAPVAQIPAQARVAEDGGASTLWIACHLYLRDPITTAVLALTATRRIRVALMAMSPYSTHPVFIAMAAATLDEMYPGRVILSLGTGAPADLEAAGITSPKPVATLRETIALCRTLFAGEELEFHGEVFRARGRRLVNAPRAIPIVVAASRTKMLKLAGEAADGVLVSAATSPAFVRVCLDTAMSGRAFRKLAIVYTRVAPTEQRAIDALRLPTASCCGGRIMRKTSGCRAHRSTRRRSLPLMRPRTGPRCAVSCRTRSCGDTPPAARPLRSATNSPNIVPSVSTR